MKFKLECKKIINLPPPSVDMYYKIYYPVNTKDQMTGILDWLGSGKIENRAYIQAEDIEHAKQFLSEWLKDMRKEEPYAPPTVVTDTPESGPYKTTFHEMKLVYEYTGIDFGRLRELDILTFWRYFRDAVIYRAIQSESGKEYLNKAYNSVQTKPDRVAIAELIEAQA